MSFLDKLFGKQKNTAPQQSVFMEIDNCGTRHDSQEYTSAYWITRLQSSHKDPFVLYDFDTEKNARDALLELPCIHVAQDSGKLICTEVLNFGVYRTDDGKYEAVICGDDLTHDLWAQAKKSFIKHGGLPKGQGDLEPEKRAPAQTAAKPQVGKVVFVREDRQNKMGATYIYRIYKGPDGASAKAFLEQHPVTQKLVYVIVETPEGNYARDIDGIYKE